MQPHAKQPQCRFAALRTGDLSHGLVNEANGKIIATEGDAGIHTTVNGFSVRRDWLRQNREIAIRFLRAIVIAYDLQQKDPEIGVRALAREMGLERDWAKRIYADAPPPNVYEWADPRYYCSLVEDSPFHKRLDYLSDFCFRKRSFQWTST